MSGFNVGDIVKPKDGQEGIVAAYAGESTDGLYRITTVREVTDYLMVVPNKGHSNPTPISIKDFRFNKVEDPEPLKDGDVVRVKAGHGHFVGETFHDRDLTVLWVTGDRVSVTNGKGSTQSTEARHFEKVQAVRVEGKEIAPKDIKVGDEILVTRIGTEGITHMRQGVVNALTKTDDQYGKGLLLKVGYGSRLNWGQGLPETFTLIKAAPERDVLLDRLVGAIGGTAVTFRESLARKQNDEKWTMLTGTNVNVMTTEGLRTYIKDSAVTWLKAEG